MVENDGKHHPDLGPEYTRLPLEWHPGIGLTSREEDSISLWLGVDRTGGQFQKLSYKQIGEHIGLSRTGAARVVKRALIKIAALYFVQQGAKAGTPDLPEDRSSPDSADPVSELSPNI